MHNDQIRIPGQVYYSGTINNENVKLYSTFFRNEYYNSEIMEVTKEKNQTNYIGCPWSKKIDFIEIGGLFGKRYNFFALPYEERKKHQEKYNLYIDEIKKMKRL